MMPGSCGLHGHSLGRQSTFLVSLSSCCVAVSLGLPANPVFTQLRDGSVGATKAACTAVDRRRTLQGCRFDFAAMTGPAAGWSLCKTTI